MAETTTQGRFDGARAVVTGAGSGIGKATAERLLGEGARVVAADISALRLQALAAEHPGAPLGTVVDPDTIRQIVAAAGGGVDVLANVAGIMDGFVPTAELDGGWSAI